MSLISCRNIKITYDGCIAVDDVSFCVEKGDYLFIVGENGSGKSTLLKGILGLIKPVNGQVIYNGLKKSEIGYLPQQTMVQKDFPASVYEVVLTGCLNRHGVLPFYRKCEKEFAEKNIKLLGIDKIKKKSYRDLSCGQQQRVLLARSLLATDKLLLLDEPFTGLDPLMSYELHQLIKTLNADRGVTIIIVSHDIKNAIQYGNKILHLDKKAVFFGSMSKYLTTDICREMLGGRMNA